MADIRARRTEQFFKAALVVKGLDGAVELIGAAEFASGNRTFVLVYLGLHGVVKLALVWALLRKWRPAYPVAAVVLGLFVVYELIRAVHTGSVVLPLLAALD